MCTGKPILTISLLTSNRMETIPRCLDSLKPILEAIPSELIIVDTSNNPEIYECNLRYTDRVEKFEWCNDFSKARNTGLNKAEGEWFMFIDDDEWFLDSAPLIDFFASGEYKEYGVAYYCVCNYLDKDFEITSKGWVKRLIKLEEDTQFRGKVHESLGPEVGRIKLLDAVIGHTGYIFETDEDREKHFQRNVSLLKKMEQEEPDVLRWKILMVQEYRSSGKWHDLELYCRDSIEYLRKQSYRVHYSEVGQIYLGYIYALLLQDKNKDAVTMYTRCKNVFENSFLKKGYLNALMTKIYYEFGDYEASYQHACDYIEAYKVYQEAPEKYRHEEVGNVFAEPFTKILYGIVCRCKFVCAFELEKYESMKGHYSEVWADETDLNTRVKIQGILLDTFSKQRNYVMLEEILEEDVKSAYMRPFVANWLVKVRKTDAEEFQMLSNVIKEKSIWRWYELYTEFPRLQELEKKDVEEIASDLIMTTPNVFQIPDTVHKVFEERGIELEGVYARLDFMIWKSHLEEHFSCINMKQLDELKTRLESSSLNGDIRFAYFMMLYAEQKLLHTEDCDKKFEFYNEMLYLFSQYTCATYETLYAEEIQNMELGQLPHNYQAALWLKIYFEEVEKDIKAALLCLSKVIEIYPLLRDVTKGYLECIKQEMSI